MSCNGCGAPSDPRDPRPDRCSSCPPETCTTCGGINHIATDRMCACWVSVEDIPFADLKGLFAQADLSLDTPGGTR